ncbi:MAG: F0F1 ATP synthase subunit B [Armatimonadota bacterium]
MQIDWVTVLAQIANFVILMLLLKHFLYGPIVRAMEERQQRIAERMREAQEREMEAEEEARSHREQRAELQAQRDDLLEQARAEAAQERERLIDRARDEVEALERRWQEELRDEREAFLRELRRCMAQQVCAVARRVLVDLADRELQAQVISIFTRRLESLDQQTVRELRAAVARDDRRPRLAAAFDLSEEQRRALRAALQPVLADDAQLEFECSEELLCGVELIAGGCKLAWSVDSYLEALEERALEALEREMQETAEDEESREDARASERGAQRRDDSG